LACAWKFPGRRPIRAQSIGALPATIVKPSIDTFSAKFLATYWAYPAYCSTCARKKKRGRGKPPTPRLLWLVAGGAAATTTKPAV